MRHVQTRILRKGPFEPPGDLLWGPVCRQLLSHQGTEQRREGEPTGFRTPSSVPGTRVGNGRTVLPSATVPSHLPADRRWRSTQAHADLPHGVAPGQAPGDFLPLRQGERASRPGP